MTMDSGIWYILVGAFGASIGSFITMLLYRMHTHTPFASDRSRCTGCGKTLHWFELIPIISFLFLKWRCRKCKKKIPIRYLVIEVMTTILYLYTWYNFVNTDNQSVLLLIRDWIVIFVAVFTFFYDFLYLEVSLPITIGGGIAAATLYIAYDMYEWQSIAAGIVLGVGWFGLQYVVSRGRWIGGGDIMIGFFIGATLGLGKTILALGCAYVLGGSYGLMLLVTKKKARKDQIAFGTFLAASTLAALWWGNDILLWYTRILGLKI